MVPHMSGVFPSENTEIFDPVRVDFITVSVFCLVRQRILVHGTVLDVFGLFHDFVYAKAGFGS